MDMTRRRFFELGKRIRTAVTRADIQSNTRSYEIGRLNQNEEHYEWRQNSKRKRRKPIRSTTKSPTEYKDQTIDPRSTENVDK